MTDEELPVYLDGPKLIAFLESEGITRGILTEAQKRRWWDWEQGGRASIYKTAGQILTEHQISEALIPEDVWCEDQSGPGRKKKAMKPAEWHPIAEAGFVKGRKTADIAIELGLSPDTVRKFRKGWQRRLHQAERELKKQEAIEMLKRGVPSPEIRRELDVPEASLRRWKTALDTAA